MKVAILVYDTCVQFEVIIAAYLCKYNGEVVTVGLEMKDYQTMEGFIVRPHMLLEDLDPDSIDAFIVPGGYPESIMGNLILGKKLRSVNERGKLIAAICGGPVHLGKAGILNGKRFTTTVLDKYPEAFEGGTYVDEDVVEDGNILTAWPNAYVDFAVKIGDRLNLFKDQADREETVRIFKGFQRC